MCRDCEVAYMYIPCCGLYNTITMQVSAKVPMQRCVRWREAIATHLHTQCRTKTCMLEVWTARRLYAARVFTTRRTNKQYNSFTSSSCLFAHLSYHHACINTYNHIQILMYLRTYIYTQWPCLDPRVRAIWARAI